MGAWVTESVVNGVGVVRMDRPEVHNAFNEDVIAGLTAAFENLGRRPDVRVIVLRSEGPSFSAGADLSWMQKMVDYSFEANVADAGRLAAMLDAIRHCPRPVIARVQGAALGGGVGLVAACDMAVALDSAVFGLTEVRLGIIPAVIGPYVLEKVGPGAARRYFLTAERFGAAEALRIGLVHQVADTAEALDETVAQWCAAIGKNGPEAVTAAKRLVDEVLATDWQRMNALTARRIAERRASPEGQEGMRAFLEKRPAAWLGGRS